MLNTSFQPHHVLVPRAKCQAVKADVRRNSEWFALNYASYVEPAGLL